MKMVYGEPKKFKKHLSELEERYLLEKEIKLLGRIRRYADDEVQNTTPRDDEDHYSWEEVYRLMRCST